MSRLLDQTEINNKVARDNACRALLYLVQGNHNECGTMEEYHKNLADNVVLLYECDAFSILTDLLMFEIE